MQGLTVTLRMVCDFPDVTDGSHGPVTFQLRGDSGPHRRVELVCESGPVAFGPEQLHDVIELLVAAEAALHDLPP